MVDRDEREAALRELYGQVPAIVDCRGRCHDSCRSPLDVSFHEAARARRSSGRRLVPGDGCRACSLLTDENRCAVYDDRPMMCRLFGAARGLECEHGCRPVRWLSEGQAIWLFLRALEIGGTAAAVPDPDEMRRLADRHPHLIKGIRGALTAGALQVPE